MIRPVILCGGAGTRLWPLSRKRFPKQLLRLTGQQSLLQQTAIRLTGAEFAPAILVSGKDQGEVVRRQLDEVAAPLEAILLEPVARNTAAAAALAAAWVTRAERDELLLVMPSDHVIEDREALLEAIRIGRPHAEAGSIVTFGAQPTEANTQFGYIEARLGEGDPGGAFPISRFVEKPNSEKAAEYFASGRFYWNAGIFLLKASTLIEEMRRFLPDTLAAVSAAVANASADGILVRPERKALEQSPNISIDHGIMEKTSRGMVVPVRMGWSDVGSWDAVWKLGNKDSEGNVTGGDVLAFDTHASLIRSEADAPLIAAIGLDRMAVIAVPDAVLVAPLDRVSEVKHVVEQLAADGRECVVSSSKSVREWGASESLAKGHGFEVRHLDMSAGRRLFLEDLQISRHWIVVAGAAEIMIGKRACTVAENDSIFIPVGTKVRITTSEVPLRVVEILLGSSSSNGDQRFDDNFQRAGPEQ